MTQEDFIKCGCWFTDTGALVTDDIDLNAFAKLIAEKEREKDLFLLQTNAEAYASEGKQATANLLFAMANIIRARGQA